MSNTNFILLKNISTDNLISNKILQIDSAFLTLIKETRNFIRVTANTTES